MNIENFNQSKKKHTLRNHLASGSQAWWLERNASKSYFPSGILTFFCKISS